MNQIFRKIIACECDKAKCKSLIPCDISGIPIPIPIPIKQKIEMQTPFPSIEKCETRRNGRGSIVSIFIEGEDGKRVEVLTN